MLKLRLFMLSQPIVIVLLFLLFNAALFPRSGNFDPFKRNAPIANGYEIAFGLLLLADLIWLYLVRQKSRRVKERKGMPQ